MNGNKPAQKYLNYSEHIITKQQENNFLHSFNIGNLDYNLHILSLKVKSSIFPLFRLLVYFQKVNIIYIYIYIYTHIYFYICICAC